METINEFIEALNSKAELEKERAFYDAVKWNHITAYGEYCRKLEAEYRQLAEWLKELKAYRKNLTYRNNLTNQSLSDALVHSENENERLHDKVNELLKELQVHREAWEKCIKEIKDWHRYADKQTMVNPSVVDAMIDLFIKTIEECRPKEK